MFGLQKLFRKNGRDRAICPEIFNTKIDEDILDENSKPKFISSKTGKDNTSKVLSKACSGKINLSKVNQDLVNIGYDSGE